MASRIEGFALTVVAALGTVIVPFVGQNLGAGKLHRVKEAMSFSQLFAMAWGALFFVLFLFLARPIAEIFNDNPQVVEAASQYLLHVSVSYGVFGMFQLITASFNAMNRPVQAAAVSLVRAFVFYVPLAALGRHMFGLAGIFGAAAVANILSGAFAFVWLSVTLRNMASRNGEQH